MKLHELLALAALGIFACVPSLPVHTKPHPKKPAVAEPKPSPPLGRLPEGVRPTHYDLRVEIVPDRERFSGEVAIDVDLERAEDAIWLHGRGLDVRSATVTPTAGQPVKATYSELDPGGVAQLRLASAVGPGTATIHIAYSGAFEQHLAGLYRVAVGGEHYAFTQMEPVGARQAFPCFDEPAHKTPFDVTLTAKAADRVIANTQELSREDVDGGLVRVRFATTQPLPTYLIAFAVGPLDVVDAPAIPASDVRSAPLPFRGIAAKGRGPELAHALAETPAILQALEAYFGVAYPYDKLDILAVPERQGAMENAGAITFREWLLLMDPKTAPVQQRYALAYVVAHELSHMWFGDLVTMPWWDDIWLNEAFATWMGNRVVHGLHPDWDTPPRTTGQTQDAMAIDSLMSARQIRQPVDKNDDIHAAFDQITYRKGGGVLGMFERWLGADTFQKGLQRYMRSHSYGSATADDLLAALSEVSEKDVATPFNTFLRQPGLPVVAVTPSCTGKEARLDLTQSRFLPLGSKGTADKLWQVPVCMRYGKGNKVGEACTLLVAQKGTLPLPLCPDWVMPNAGAAGYYTWSLPMADLEHLVAALPSLDDSERMSLGRAVIDALRSGALGPKEAAALLKPLALASHPDVVRAPMELWRRFRYWLEEDPLLPKAEELARAWFRPAWAKLGWKPRKNEPARSLLLRRELTAFLLHVGRDNELRKTADALGRDFVGFGPGCVPPQCQGGAINRGVLDANLVGTVMTAMGEDADDALFDALLVHIEKANEEELRGNLLAALVTPRTSPLSGRALDLAFSPALLATEALAPLQAQLGDVRTRAAGWSWLEGHFDKLLQRLPQRLIGWLPTLPTNFCSDDAIADVRKLFKPHLAAIPGGERELEKAVEAIELCAAQKAALLPGLQAWLNDAH